ncbi:amidohydrolase family protein [Actinoallomurus acaciae]|uniref:Amidohydrolase family protein n=1 Tax=Actinoallomurus acaciae TaxID=502577 RepID=A0ABV5Y8L2_9ACTN
MQRIEADQLIPGHGEPGIMAALEAGVLTIEHGSYIDDEACTAMKDAGAILVPTFTVVREILESEDVGAYAARKAATVAEIHRENITRAYEAGVAIAMGSDLGGTGDGTAAWGRSRHASQRMSDASRFPRRLWAI